MGFYIGGACIVDTRGRVVGVGYNSMPYVRLDTNNDDTNNDDIFPWDKVLKGPCGKKKTLQIVKF